MLDPAQARVLLQHALQATPRAHHSECVAYLMKQLASHFHEDTQLWEVVGLCHDLDFLTTRTDPTQHGLVTAAQLHDHLPPAARNAIAAHDHRTGVLAQTRLADLLKVADALAVIDTYLGRDWLARLAATDDPTYAQLQAALADRPYLVDLLRLHAAPHGLSLPFLIRLLLGAPFPYSRGVDA